MEIAQYIPMFVRDAREKLAEFRRQLEDLESTDQPRVTASCIRRMHYLAHQLKSSAAVVGLKNHETRLKAVEEFLKPKVVADGNGIVIEDHNIVLLQMAHETIERMVEDLAKM